MNNEKKAAKIVWKRFKACGFNIELLHKRFELSTEEKNLYNKYYGLIFGKI